MFGYVNVNSAELKVKEYELYKSIYCGLCRSMGKCTGQCSRMTLSYDFTFLAAMRLALEHTPVEFEKKRCLAHPLTKRTVMKRNGVLDYCSGAAAILNYQKIRDDINDEKGLKRLKALLTLPFVSHARKKALKRQPNLTELDSRVSAELQGLSEIERKKTASADLPAAAFGSLLGEITSFELRGADKRTSYALGRAVGIWIYLADALDDMYEDKNKNRYNPIIELYGGSLPTSDELSSIFTAIKNGLFDAEAAFDLMDIEDEGLKNIIANVLFSGIVQRTDAIITAHKEKLSPKGKNK